MGLAMQALEGNYTSFLKNLKTQILLYNVKLQFEKSRNLQEYVVNFEKIFATLKTHFTEKKYEKEAALATAPVNYKPTANPALADALQHMFKLPKPIHTIDCFDISHFQSNALVGSCIRFTDGIPEKNKFRRFKIKTLTQQNDYAALQEIVARRYRNVDNLPDLILIDGGKGQLSAVKHLHPQTPFISLAKKEETIFSNSFPEGIKLDIQNEVGKLLIALRDYAHHFAITYHRNVRAKERSNEYGKIHQRRTRTIKS
jgi:excinuclease ABC subunit C